MKHIFLTMFFFFLASISASAGDLIKISLDDASVASPKIETDSNVKTEGDASIRITAKWPATVFLAEIPGPKVENAKLVYSADVKCDMQGSAFLEMWAHVGGGQYFSKGMKDSVTGESDWKTIRTPFFFQKGRKPDKITLNIVLEGPGTVWIDNIVLSVEPR